MASISYNWKEKPFLFMAKTVAEKVRFIMLWKTFFQSSNETINYDETENVFLTQRQKGKDFIEITFNPDKDENTADKNIF